MKDFLNRHLFWGVLLSGLLFSCQEEVDLGPSPLSPQLVVDGQITNERQRHEVSLSLSGDFAQEEPFVPATGAAVRISDGENIFILTEEEPGLYLTDSIRGEPETTYTLTIEWEGTTYTAIDSMGAVPEDFTPVNFLQEQGYREFEYRRHQFGFSEPNKWELIVQRPDTTTIPPIEEQQFGLQIGLILIPPGHYHYTFFTHPNIEVNGLLNLEDAHFYRFFPDRLVVQKRYSISENYYEYLRGLFMETEWRESLFSSFPANIKGNVDQGALGFFNASAVRSVSFYLE